MGEYEPNDSRNVTGAASTPDGRWTNTEGKPPLAAGEPAPVKQGDHQSDPKADLRTDAAESEAEDDLPEVPLAVEKATGE